MVGWSVPSVQLGVDRVQADLLAVDRRVRADRVPALPEALQVPARWSETSARRHPPVTNPVLDADRRVLGQPVRHVRISATEGVVGVRSSTVRTCTRAIALVVAARSASRRVGVPRPR